MLCFRSLLYQLELNQATDYQSGTKPNLVAKILATNFGVFFVIYVMFSKICSMCL